jgi:Uma2 family endonuclease
MSGASAEHNFIAANVLRALGGLLDARPCVALGSDQRIHVEATGLYTYPDVTVVCDPPRFHAADPLSLTNPVLLVEVLSSTSEDYDRGAKFSHYRTIPSLREVLLIAQEERRIDHYARLETGQWLLTELREGAVELPCLGVSLDVAPV